MPRRSMNRFALLTGVPEDDLGDQNFGTKKTEKNRRKKKVQHTSRNDHAGDWQTAGKRRRIVKEKIDHEEKFLNISKSLEGKLGWSLRVVQEARAKLEEEGLDWSLKESEIKRKIVDKVHELEKETEMERKMSSDEEELEEEESQAQSATTGTNSDRVEIAEETDGALENSQLWNESKEEEVPPSQPEEMLVNDTMIPPPTVEKPLDLKEKLLQELDQFDFEKDETARVIDGWIRLLKGEGEECQEFQKACGPSKIVMKILRSPKSCLKYKESLVLLFDQILQGSHEYHAWIFQQFSNLAEKIMDASLTKNVKKTKIEESAAQLMELLMKEPEDPILNNTPQKQVFVPPSSYILPSLDANLNVNQWKSLDTCSEQMHKSTFELSNYENEVAKQCQYKPRIFEKLRNQRDKIENNLMMEKHRVEQQERQYSKNLEKQKSTLQFESQVMNKKTQGDEERRLRCINKIKQCEIEKERLEEKLRKIDEEIERLHKSEEMFSTQIEKAQQEHMPKIDSCQNGIKDTEMRLKAEKSEGQCYTTLELIATSFSNHLSQETDRTDKAKLRMKNELEQSYLQVAVQYISQANTLYQQTKSRCTFLENEILESQKKNVKFQELALHDSLKRRTDVLEQDKHKCEQFNKVATGLQTLIFKIKQDAKENLSQTHIIQLTQALREHGVPQEFAPDLPTSMPTRGVIGSHLNSQPNYNNQQPPPDYFRGYPPSSKRKPPMNRNITEYKQDYKQLGFQMHQPMQQSMQQPMGDFQQPMENPPRPERYEEDFEHPQHFDEPMDSYEENLQFEQHMEHENLAQSQVERETNALLNEDNFTFEEEDYQDEPFHTPEPVSTLQHSEPVSNFHTKKEERPQPSENFESSTRTTRKPPIIKNMRPAPVENKSEKLPSQPSEDLGQRNSRRRRAKTKRVAQSGMAPIQSKNQPPSSSGRATQRKSSGGAPLRTQGKPGTKSRKTPNNKKGRGRGKGISKAANTRKKAPTLPAQKQPPNKKDPAKPQQLQEIADSQAQEPQPQTSQTKNWSNLVGKKRQANVVQVERRQPKLTNPVRGRGRGRKRNRN